MRQLGEWSTGRKIVPGETFQVGIHPGVLLGGSQDLTAGFEHLADRLAGASREQGQFAPCAIGQGLETRLRQREYRLQRQHRADDVPVGGLLQGLQRRTRGRGVRFAGGRFGWDRPGVERGPKIGGSTANRRAARPGFGEQAAELGADPREVALQRAFGETPHARAGRRFRLLTPTEKPHVHLTFAGCQARERQQWRAAHFFDHHRLGQVPEAPCFHRRFFPTPDGTLPGVGPVVGFFQGRLEDRQVAPGGEKFVVAVHDFDARAQVRGQAVRRPVGGLHVHAVAFGEEGGERGQKIRPSGREVFRDLAHFRLYRLQRDADRFRQRAQERRGLFGAQAGHHPLHLPGGEAVDGGERNADRDPVTFLAGCVGVGERQRGVVERDLLGEQRAVEAVRVAGG